MAKLLLTNAGRRTYFVEYALDLVDKGLIEKVYVSDVDKVTASFFVSDRVETIITPKVSDTPDLYIKHLTDSCIEHGIDIIIPLMEYELPLLSAAHQSFKDIGVKVVVSEEEVINKTLNKGRCFEFCQSNGISTPKTYLSHKHLEDGYVLPLIKKPITGSGSIGIEIIYSEKKLKGVNFDDFILQEYIDGDEYGVDILNDLEGNYVHSCFRKKILKRSGETDKSESILSTYFSELIEEISYKCGHYGNMDIDFIVKNNEVFFIDFNPRFGGGYPSTHESGLNYLQYILEMIILKKSDIEISKFIPSVVIKGISIHSYPKD